MKKAIIKKIIEINNCCVPIVNTVFKDNAFGIYDTSERVLLEIYSCDSFSAISIAKKFNMNRAYIGRIIKQLEKKALIKRTRSLDDARVFLLELTPKGKTYTETLIKRNNAELLEKFSLLSSEEQNELMSAFNRITDILK